MRGGHGSACPWRTGNDPRGSKISNLTRASRRGGPPTRAPPDDCGCRKPGTIFPVSATALEPQGDDLKRSPGQRPISVNLKLPLPRQPAAAGGRLRRMAKEAVKKCPGKQKHFTQRRKGAKGAKRTKRLFFARLRAFAAWREIVYFFTPSEPWDEGRRSIPAPEGATELRRTSKIFCRHGRGSTAPHILVPTARAVGHIPAPLRRLGTSTQA